MKHFSFFINNPNNVNNLISLPDFLQPIQKIWDIYECFDIKVPDLTRLSFPCPHNLESTQIWDFHDLVIEKRPKLSLDQEQN